jgi:hypothetical protein
MPPYQANIPQPGDQISVSQGDLLGNFASIDAGFTQNHIGFNAGAGNAGQHNFVQLFPRAAAPAFAGSPGFWASTAAGNPLFLHTAAGVDIDISTRTFASNVSGSTFLPSGLLLKFGRGTTVGAGATLVVNMNLILPIYNVATVPFILITPEQAPGNLYRWAQLRPGWTSANFTVDTGNFAGAPAVTSFQWFAIGIV